MSLETDFLSRVPWHGRWKCAGQACLVAAIEHRIHSSIAKMFNCTDLSDGKMC